MRIEGHWRLFDDGSAFGLILQYFVTVFVTL